MASKINIAIVGASGYTGLELIKIIINHPQFDITYIANSKGEQKLSSLHPSLQDVFGCDYDISKADANEIKKHADLVFLALPHKTSMGFAKELLKLGLKVVDLSADYRLELDTYEKHYCPHEDKENLSKAVYGLPEFYKDEIAKTNLVANPGCYPTATLLGLIPFAKYIEPKVFIDAKSGVSGAGKKLSELNTYVNINENIFAYAPLTHRHFPEIDEKVSKITNTNLDISFVPHLMPVSRGMLISTYATIKDEYLDINPLEILKEFYKDNKFVRIYDTPVNIKNSSGTNYCDIFASSFNNTLFISSAIDNLLRGASSQAVVNANIMCGFAEDMGIPTIAYVP